MTEFIYEEDKDPFEKHNIGGKPGQKPIKGNLNENIMAILQKPPIDITQLTEENK